MVQCTCSTLTCVFWENVPLFQTFSGEPLQSSISTSSNTPQVQYSLVGEEECTVGVDDCIWYHFFIIVQYCYWSCGSKIKAFDELQAHSNATVLVYDTGTLTGEEPVERIGNIFSWVIA